MEATGVSHIAVCVRDMDKSLAFYRDILGLRVKKDEVQDTSQGGLPHTYKHPRKTRRTVHLTYEEGRTPFLVLTSHPGDQADGEPIKLDQVGVSHLSFSVRDVKALAETLISKDVPLAGGMDAFSDATGAVRTFFAYDPDGILVQFDDGDAG